MVKIGTRVKIERGMREFIGKIGTIVNNLDRDGRVTMYRVRFEHPIAIRNVGDVTDDLWARDCFKVLKSEW